jgi:hypothetical protein
MDENSGTLRDGRPKSYASSLFVNFFLRHPFA